jgi:hypothetical protein
MQASKAKSGRLVVLAVMAGRWGISQGDYCPFVAKRDSYELQHCYNNCYYSIMVAVGTNRRGFSNNNSLMSDVEWY